jgi:hypothetical protein
VIDELLAFLGASGAQKQIDLGNFSVGMATLCLAAATIFIAFRRSKRENYHKVAEFRRDWLEKTRQTISDHCFLSHKITTCYISGKSEDANTFFSEMFSCETILRLRLNPRDPLAVSLLEEMVKLRQSCGEGQSLNKFKGTDRSAKMNAYLDKVCLSRGKIIHIGNQLLKLEWEKIKSEIHRKSRINRLLDKFRMSTKGDDAAAWPDVALYIKEKET